MLQRKRKTPVAIRKQTPRNRTPRSRGPHGFSVPEAGAMVGLSVNSSYEAAKRGEIPTIPFGNLLIVPRKIWLRKIGVETADDAAA
jgi:hypothetical protein